MVDFWHFFAICILYLVFCLCICVFLSFLEQQFLSISASKYSFDDDYDDSGGRTQRDCLTLTAPDRGKDKYSLCLAQIIHLQITIWAKF